MKREEFEDLCDLSERALGHKYAWKKLMKKGLVSEYQRVGRRGATARRMPLTTNGVKQYLVATLEMQAKMKQDMEASKCIKN